MNLSELAMLSPCLLGDIRLVGDTPLAGRIEIYFNGEWGTVCRHPSWDFKIVRVACAQLGYGFVQTRRIHFGDGAGQILLSGLECTGNEERLVDCQRDAEVRENCDHSADAGVQCTDEILPKFTQTGKLQQYPLLHCMYKHSCTHRQVSNLEVKMNG